MQELSRTLSLFLWPISLAFLGFFLGWTTLLWLIDGDPAQFWPRVGALALAILVYVDVRRRIDTYLGPGLANWALFPLRYVGANALAIPVVAISSALLWRILLLHLLPGWCFWIYLVALILWVWPWWVEHFLRAAFSFQVPAGVLARALERVASHLVPRPLTEPFDPPPHATTAPESSFITTERSRTRSARVWVSVSQRIFAWAELRARDSERRVEHVAGPKRLSKVEAERAALDRLPETPARLGWSVPLPPLDGPLGFVALGAPGTGKSLLIQRTMASVLPRIGEEGEKRALLYDHKGEALALLARFGVARSRVVLFHPFAAETAVWDIGRDLTQDTDVKEFTHIVLQVPEQYRADPFWIHAAEFVMQAVIKGLRELRGDSWTLADLCRALHSKERILHFTQAAQNGAYRLLYMTDAEHEKVFLSVLATLQAEFQDWEPIAKQWWWAEKTHHARRYSLTEWIAGSDILVLGHAEAHSRVFVSFQRAFFALAAKRVFDSSRHDEASHPERSWFFLDEVQNMARGLDALPRLVNSARGKGVCVVLGVQDIAGLEKLYPRLAQSLLNGISHWACFRTNNPETASWLAAAFGQRRVREKLLRWDRYGVPQDSGERLLDEALVRAEDFMAANRGDVLRAYCKSENLGVWKDELPRRGLVAQFGSPSLEEKRLAGPSPMEEFGELPDWSEAEKRRFGLKEKEGPDAKESDDDAGYRPHTG